VINSAEAASYVPSLSARSVLSNIGAYMGPLASLREQRIMGVPVLGLAGVVGALIVAEHLRRRRGR